MKKTKAKKIIAVMMAVVMCLGMTNIFAFAAAADNDIVAPANVAIITTGNNLTRSGGTLTCYGQTTVQNGYTAEVVVELQQDGSTIKTWTSKGGSAAMINEYRAVASGHTYQLKLTHKAYSGSTLVETITKYSNVIVYN